MKPDIENTIRMTVTYVELENHTIPKGSSHAHPEAFQLLTNQGVAHFSGHVSFYQIVGVS